MRIILLLINLLPFSLNQYFKKINIHYFDKEKILFEEVINDIKNTEGFVNKPYLCPSGKLTIGYGHRINNYEHYDTISEVVADSLLRKDFQLALDYVNKLHKSLDYNQQLSIAHFIFSLGIETYNKSSLKKKIIDNNVNENDFLKYCKYRTSDSTYKESLSLKRSRLFEYKMFCKKM
jgi:GH24 family phage-related lysozyme (muramidase)